MTRILAFSGSNRRGSVNTRTVAALSAAATVAGASVESLDLGELDLPIYNADLEAASGLPPGAAHLRSKLKEADAFIVGCPEYNGFVTPLLLNAIDWSTRSEEKRPDLSCYASKPVLVSSASPGAFGGMRAASHLRTLLAGIGCLVFPQIFVVPSALQAFSEDGSFANETLSERADQIAGAFVQLVDKLSVTQDCEHDWLVRGRTLALTFTIDDWQGPVEFISRCTGCGRFALLRLLYWTGVRLDTRVFAVSLLGNEAAGTFLHDMETGYCDLQRHAAELMALVSSAGPIERVVTTSPGPVVRSSCPTAYAPSLASRPWREIEPGREDERWHKLLEDA